MQIVQAPRASAILYSLLADQENKQPWLLPANICPIVPITFLKAYVPFQFVDISAETLHMDLDQAEALIRERPFGGILYAHTYGEVSTPNDFFTEIKEHYPKLMIIDDRCLCIPDLEPESSNRADVQLYSTGYAKIVHLGFGGYAFLCNDINYEPAQISFNPQHHEEVEAAYKQAIREQIKFEYQDSDWLDTATAIPAWEAYREQIKKGLMQSLQHRSSLNQIYASMLPAEIQLPAAYQTWRFNIRLKNKQSVLDKIFSAGLFVSSHYASLAGIMSEDTTPHADDLANSVINLFNDHHFTIGQAERVAKIILENFP